MAMNLVAILAVTCGLLQWLPEWYPKGTTNAFEESCSEPAPVSGAYRTRWNSTNALYVCLDGHSPVDEFSITCNESQWPPTNRCKVDCGNPVEVDGATLFVNDTEEGAVAEYRCYDNYTDITSEPLTGTCSTLTGRWTNEGAVCTGPEDLALHKSSSSPDVTDGNGETCTDSTSVLVTISTDDFYNIHTVILNYSNPIGEVNVTLHMDYPDGATATCGRLTNEAAGAHVVDCFPKSLRFIASSIHISKHAYGGVSGLCDVQAYGRMAVVDCMRPPVVVGATATYTNTSWKARAVYSCVPPYVYIGGGNTNLCKLSGWSQPTITCAEMEDFAHLGWTETGELTDSIDKTCVTDRSFVNITLDRVVEVHVVVLQAKKNIWDGIAVQVHETGTNGKLCEEQHERAVTGIYKMKAFDCPGFPFAKVVNVRALKAGELLSVCEIKVYGRDATTGALECQQTDEGPDYKGSVNFTVSGKPCLYWEDLDADIDDFPDYNMANLGNKCRNPNPGNDGPFCYVTPGVTQYCPVPMCDDVCRQGDGRTYHGYMGETRNGSSCIPWDSNPEQFPLDGIMSDRSEAVCRNPIGSMSQPWCFTESASEYELCNVPLCPVSVMVLTVNGMVSVDENQTKCFCWIGDNTASILHTSLAFDISECSETGESILLCYTGEEEQKDWVYYILEVPETATPPQSTTAETTTVTSESDPSTFEADTTSHSQETTASRQNNNTPTTDTTTSEPDNNNHTQTDKVTRPDDNDQQAETTSPTPDINTNMTEPTSETLTQQQQATSQRLQTTTSMSETTAKESESTTPVSTASLTKQNCQCRCKKDLSTGAIAAVMNERKANLIVNPRTTSAFIRKKTSAEDKRPAATMSGTSCVAVVAVMFSILFIPDIINLLTFIFKLKK